MRFLTLTLLILLISAASSHAQSRTPVDLSIHVVDPAGTSIPDATVSVQTSNTNSYEVDKTGRTGIVKFAKYPGTYNVIVSSAGFAPFQKVNIEIMGESPVTLNAQLRISSYSGPVVVVQAPLIRTESIPLNLLIVQLSPPAFKVDSVKFRRSMLHSQH